MASGKTSAPRPSRAESIADTAIDLLAERGLRGLTHRAVDEAAGLPQGSTSNHARTREALLEAAVRRLAVREADVLAPREMPDPDAGSEAMAEALALALHRYLTRHRRLAVARYELALEATRRPALRAAYDRAGTRAFREPLVAAMAAAGSSAPERHALSLIAWCEGVMFSCTAGSHHSTVPDPQELRTGLGELLRGMLGG
ncbi:TetR family transcriptional regulator [Streptomyces sp. TRM43335]|uniref:TetR family transcriptional regulator n=1 Tax=Streptomyces taklimakanensis TaxID=2569853 RepID=A0A6G2BIP8_9ACTN|nr:TetR/AcrR family transcriptional regulator [Streptomyces taklimakanensis]MTE22120.1 TetR family transcriptional regulator [Streptomyces taklimakanensis]